MTVYGPTKDAVKEAFWRIVDKAEEHQCGVDWLELSEPAFFRGSVGGNIRDAQGWHDPPAYGGLSLRTYVRTHLLCCCCLLGLAWFRLASFGFAALGVPCLALPCLALAWLGLVVLGVA